MQINIVLLRSSSVAQLVVSHTASLIEPHVSVHLKTASVVHSLLLLLKLAHLLANSCALRNRTVIVLALLRMDAQKGPDSLAYSTTSLNLHFAYAGVLQVALHLGTICGRTSLGITTRCMLNQLNMKHEIALSL